jgi:hypothetical protein
MNLFRLSKTGGLLAAALLTACSGSSTGEPPPIPTSGPALTRAQPGELRTFLAARVRQRLGLGSPLVTGAAGAPAPAPSGDAALSGTLVQESGVDEDDLIKADADAIYTLHAGELRRDRLSASGQPERQQSLPLAPEPDAMSTSFHGFYLPEGATRAAVVGTAWQVGDWQGDCGAEVCTAFGLISVVPTVPRVLVQPVSTGATMAVENRIVIDGRLVGTRRVGQRLVVVTTHLPALAVDALPASATAADREAALAALKPADLLPGIRVGAAAAVPLVAETDCYLQPGNGSTDVEITTITVFDLASPALTRQSQCFVGGSEGLYMSTDSLYLATTRWVYDERQVPVVYPSEVQTDIHKFSLDGAGVSYRASGTVPGHLGWDTERKPFRLGEWNGHLRVLSFTGSLGWATAADANGSGTPSPATLTVLREDGSALKEVARLPNAQRPEPLGKPGEQIYGVRFIENRGYVVTFRQLDPLYLLDLSDPADPRAAGVLEVPGFSQDLFPMGSGWLLGVGREVDSNGMIQGVKLALFDVRDEAAPRLQASQTLGGTGTVSALDFSRHGLNLRWQDGVARVALPVALWEPDGWRQGLQRLSVDPAAGTMSFKPLVERTPSLAYPDVTIDRSLQIGDRLLYLSQGQLSAGDW